MWTAEKGCAGSERSLKLATHMLNCDDSESLLGGKECSKILPRATNYLAPAWRNRLVFQ